MSLHTDRNTLIKTFLDTHIKGQYTLKSLAGDASFRRYHRIYVEDKTFLLMDAPPNKESVEPFVHVAGIIKKTVNVPDIFAKDTDKGFLLLQDFGETQFADVIGGEDSDKWYTLAMQTLIKLQTTPCADIFPYREHELIAEMVLFVQWFLPYLGVASDEILWQSLVQEVVKNVLAQPLVLVHRDYHSRNLMVDKAQNLGVIDFQDACVGAYTYDLASLLRDAYVGFDEQWVNTKIAEFHKSKGIDVDIDTFTQQVNVMGVQRHLKVLGIFVRLFKRDGKTRYLDNLPKVMKDLQSELIWLKEHDDNPIWGQFLAWLNKTVMDEFNAKLGVKKQ